MGFHLSRVNAMLPILIYRTKVYMSMGPFFIMYIYVYMHIYMYKQRLDLRDVHVYIYSNVYIQWRDGLKLDGPLQIYM